MSWNGKYLHNVVKNCSVSLSVIVTHHHDRLSGNKLSEIKGEVFASLNNLNVLNLSHNRFYFPTVKISPKLTLLLKTLLYVLA